MMASSVQAKRKGPNRLELAGREILDAMYLDYEEQVLLAGRVRVDAYIPKAMLAIQWDGDYWHRIPKRVSIDAEQNSRLVHHGYRVARFWETDVHKRPEWVEDRLRDALQEVL